VRSRRHTVATGHAPDAVHAEVVAFVASEEDVRIALELSF